jgi:branched-chain amino acid transport system permease protein
VSNLVEEIALGVATGCVYALLALGLTLIYQVSGVVNFAQGALAAAGAYGIWSLIVEHGFGFWPAALITLAGMFALGALLQLALIRRLEASPAAALVATLGMLFVIEGILGVKWGFSTPFVPLSASLPISQYNLAVWGPISMSQLQVAGIAVTTAVVFVFFVFLRFTGPGQRVRAVAQSAQGARLVGVRVNRIRLLVWGISAVIATIAGILIATGTQQSPTMAEPALLSAFAGAVIGGLDSLVGAAVGAMAIGIVYNLAAFYLPNSFNSAGIDSTGVVFALLFVALIVRPAGLFGRVVQGRV